MCGVCGGGGGGGGSSLDYSNILHTKKKLVLLITVHWKLFGELKSDFILNLYFKSVDWMHSVHSSFTDAVHSSFIQIKSKYLPFGPYG